MSRLDKLWEDKILSHKRAGQIVKLKDYRPYTVQWDHPDYPRGAKTTKESFKTMDEAKDYCIKIGLEYDLRKIDKVIPSLDPRLSRYKSGYTPMEEEDNIPLVMPCVQTGAGFPTEISNEEVEEYQKKHELPTGGSHRSK